MTKYFSSGVQCWNCWLFVYVWKFEGFFILAADVLYVSAVDNTVRIQVFQSTVTNKTYKIKSFITCSTKNVKPPVVFLRPAVCWQDQKDSRLG